MTASPPSLPLRPWPRSAPERTGRSGLLLTVLVLHAALAWLLIQSTGTPTLEALRVPVRLLLSEPAAPVPPTQPTLPKPEQPPAVRPEPRRPEARPEPARVETAPTPQPMPPAAPSTAPSRELAPTPLVPPAASAASTAAPAPPVPAAVSNAAPPSPPAPRAAAVPTPSPAAPPTSAAPLAPAPVQAAAAPPPTPRVMGTLRPGSCPRPAYPEISRRLEEEGTVVLRFLVAPDGKVLQAEVEKSSGFRRLDDAARNGLANCTFEPATIDGKPVRTWATVPYTWRLE